MSDAFSLFQVTRHPASWRGWERGNGKGERDGEGEGLRVPVCPVDAHHVHHLFGPVVARLFSMFHMDYVIDLRAWAALYGRDVVLPFPVASIFVCTRSTMPTHWPHPHLILERPSPSSSPTEAGVVTRQYVTHLPDGRFRYGHDPVGAGGGGGGGGGGGEGWDEDEDGDGDGDGDEDEDGNYVGRFETLNGTVLYADMISFFLDGMSMAEMSDVYCEEEIYVVGERSALSPTLNASMRHVHALFSLPPPLHYPYSPGEGEGEAPHGSPRVS